MKGNQIIKSIFDTDNLFMRIAEKIFDLVMLNLLFVLSCLPILTIGIAKISLYQSLWELKHNRRLSIFRLYTQAFVSNWKLGLQLGVIELVILGICGFNLWLFASQGSLPFLVIKVLCLGLLIFTSLIGLCAYPLAGKYQQELRQLLQNSLVIVSLNFLWFFLMVGILLVLTMAVYLSGLTFILGFMSLLLFGFATLGFFQLSILEKVFGKYENSASSFN